MPTRKKRIQTLPNNEPPPFLVIDEWLFSYLDGSDGQEKQEIAESFIFKLLQKYKGKILLLNGCPFYKKLNQFKKHQNPRIRGISQLLNSAIMLNTNRTVFIQTDQIRNLPKRLDQIVPEDDKYLFQVYLTKRTQCCIITSDIRLIEIVKDEGVVILSVEDFIQKYPM